jgi:hypothetical protein
MVFSVLLVIESSSVVPGLLWSWDNRLVSFRFGRPWWECVRRKKCQTLLRKSFGWSGGDWRAALKCGRWLFFRRRCWVQRQCVLLSRLGRGMWTGAIGWATSVFVRARKKIFALGAWWPGVHPWSLDARGCRGRPRPTDISLGAGSRSKVFHVESFGSLPKPPFETRTDSLRSVCRSINQHKVSK